jgi:hypothetical protein
MRHIFHRLPLASIFEYLTDRFPDIPIPIPLSDAIMSPFSKSNQLVRDLELDEAGVPVITTVPGQPSLILNNSAHVEQFFGNELCSKDLERIAASLGYDNPI